jgi:SAM-dependent methyltransferase
MKRIKSFSINSSSPLDKLIGYLRFKKIMDKILPNSTVLDLGCGLDGFLLQKIRHKIIKGTGIDLEVSATFHDNKIKLISHDLDKDLPLEKDCFDFVISLASIEHLNCPNNMLKEIYRVLKPNGILLLTTPTTYAKPVLEFMAFKLNIINKNEIIDHKKYFTKKELETLCKNIGFSQYKYKYFQAFMNGFLFAKK